MARLTSSVTDSPDSKAYGMDTSQLVLLHMARRLCAPSPRVRGEGRGEGPLRDSEHKYPPLRLAERPPHPDRGACHRAGQRPDPLAIRPLPARGERYDRAAHRCVHPDSKTGAAERALK